MSINEQSCGFTAPLPAGRGSDIRQADGHELPIYRAKAALVLLIAAEEIEALSPEFDRFADGIRFAHQPDRQRPSFRLEPAVIKV